jgi:trehalose 6-phosphate synthase
MDAATRLREALSRAAERSRARAESPHRTTREDLVAWAEAHMRGRRLVIASNREPYTHTRAEDGGIRWTRNAGGLTVALDAVMQALGGVWVAHGNGDADRESSDSNGRVTCPPDRPSYTLRRVWLTEKDHERYYSGASNSALWPLCHIAYVRPRFDSRDWESYEDVNRRFAETILEETGDGPAVVFIQDYHLGLVPRFLRERRPDLVLAQFWHIPWPNPEVFRIFPWREQLLDGLLANDVLGFHIRHHALNFLDAVGQYVEARVDYDHLAVNRGGRRTWLRPFAISVPADEIGLMADSSEAHTVETRIRRQLGLDGIKVGLGVDRMDYTKGIPERLEAIQRLFEKHPEWVGRFAFIQVGVPSRIELEEYQRVLRRTRALAERINKRFPRPGGPTVHLIEANLDFRELIPYYRLADLCLVTALHDGMNLVAKEYVSASTDLDGSLVLSPFTGAARELERAHLASPYDREGLAETLHAALSEDPESRRERMRALRETIRRRNIYDWAIDVLDTVDRLVLQTPAPADGSPAPAVAEKGGS